MLSITYYLFENGCKVPEAQLALITYEVQLQMISCKYLYSESAMYLHQGFQSLQSFRIPTPG